MKESLKKELIDMIVKYGELKEKIGAGDYIEFQEILEEKVDVLHSIVDFIDKI